MMPMTHDLTSVTNNISVRTQKLANGEHHPQPSKLKVAQKGGSTSNLNTKLSSSSRGISPIYPGRSATVELSIKNKTEQAKGITAQSGGTPISGGEQPHRVAFNPMNHGGQLSSTANHHAARTGSAPKVRTRTPNTATSGVDKNGGGSTPSSQSNLMLRNSSGLHHNLQNSNSGVLGTKDSNAKNMLNSYRHGPVK